MKSHKYDRGKYHLSSILVNFRSVQDIKEGKQDQIGRTVVRQQQGRKVLNKGGSEESKK